MMGPYTRIVRGRVTSRAGGAVEDPSFEGDGKPDLLCDFGFFQAEEYHKIEGDNRLRLGANGRKPIKFINGWPGAIESSSRAIFGQLPDGRWEILAEACEE